MIEERIKELLNQQNKKLKDLCQFIDITDTGLRKIYARDSCELSTLKKIANFFNVNPTYFLDSNSSVNIHADNDSIAVGGNASNINSFKTIQKMIDEISAQRKLTEKAMEQIEKLVGVISDISKQN